MTKPALLHSVLMVCAVADEDPELPGVVHPAAEAAPPAHTAGTLDPQGMVLSTWQLHLIPLLSPAA